MKNIDDNAKLTYINDINNSFFNIIALYNFIKKDNLKV